MTTLQDQYYDYKPDTDRVRAWQIKRGGPAPEWVVKALLGGVFSFWKSPDPDNQLPGRVGEINRSGGFVLEICPDLMRSGDLFASRFGVDGDWVLSEVGDQDGLLFYRVMRDEAFKLRYKPSVVT